MRFFVLRILPVNPYPAIRVYPMPKKNPRISDRLLYRSLYLYIHNITMNQNKYKAGEQRTEVLIIRLTFKEKEKINNICQKRRKVGNPRNSQADVIMSAIDHATGSIFPLE